MTFKISTTHHEFADARDAIDAVSAYEASTAELVEYDIALCNRSIGSYGVIVRAFGGGKLGYLAPVEGLT